jgi:hypothetical protein
MSRARGVMDGAHPAPGSSSQAARAAGTGPKLRLRGVVAGPLATPTQPQFRCGFVVVTGAEESEAAPTDESREGWESYE